MTEQEKLNKLNALKGLKVTYESMIDTYSKDENLKYLVDELLEYLLKVMNEIKELEKTK